MVEAGPPAGFSEFVASASGYLTRTAFLLTGDPEAARDLVQETLTRTYAAWWRVRRPDALRYARRVLVNLHIDQYRRRTPEPAAWSDLPDHHDQYHRADDRDEARRLLAGLAPQQRRIIVLRYFADLPEAEVAACLGISVGAVKSACSRGLATLRRGIGETEEEPS